MKKELKTLTDAISKVEKLQAAQQLTATSLPSSTVNVMFHEEDQCFQCQELGHIVHHCSNVHCFECDEYGHIVVDTITRTGTETADQGCSPVSTDIIVTVIMAPTEAVPGHIIETVDATIGVLHNAVSPVLIITTVTHLIEDHPHIGVLQLIPKITADPNHTLHINQVRKLCISLHPILAELQ